MAVVVQTNNLLYDLIAFKLNYEFVIIYYVVPYSIISYVPICHGVYFSYKATGSFYKWELYYTVIATDEETGFEEKAKGLNKDKAIEEAINLILKKVTGESYSHYAVCMLMYPHLNTILQNHWSSRLQAIQPVYSSIMALCKLDIYMYLYYD